MKQPVSNPVDRFFERIKEYNALPANVAPDEAVSGVMCTLFRRISRGEALDVLFSLPARIGMPLASCALHKDELGGQSEYADSFDREEFLERVGAHLNISKDQAEAISIMVFHEIQGFLSAGEISDVASQLPIALQGLWLHKAEVPKRKVA